MNTLDALQRLWMDKMLGEFEKSDFFNQFIKEPFCPYEPIKRVWR